MKKKDTGLYIRNHSSTALLHAACQKGHRDIVDIMLNEGANIHVEDENGQTPIHLACQAGHLDIVETLVEQGADLHTADKYHMTPLRIACRAGRLDIALSIRTKQQGESIANTLRFLVTSNSIKDLKTNIAQIYLRDPLNFKNLINSTGKDGKTPLYTAIDAKKLTIKNKLQVVKLLVQQEASVHKACLYRRTPLHIACEKSYHTIIKFLLKKGADINAQDEDGLTPLHIAYQKDFLTTAKFLLENGANGSIKDKNDMTPSDYTNDKTFTEMSVNEAASILLSFNAPETKKRLNSDKTSWESRKLPKL